MQGRPHADGFGGRDARSFRRRRADGGAVQLNPRRDTRSSTGQDDQRRIDAAFLTIVRTPELHGVDLAVDVEEQRRDIRRIASTIFCSSDIDPSIVSFAICRTAAHWGMDPGTLDVLVGARLLEKAARLMAEMHQFADATPAARWGSAA